MASPLRRLNLYQINDGVAVVDVSTRAFPSATALVDAADISLMVDGNGRWFAWRAPKNAGNVYVRRHRADGGRGEYLHRAILGLSPHQMGDHINGDGLDNRRENLRPANHQENARNVRSTRGTSQYKGVFRSSSSDRWVAQIKYGRRSRHLGTFATEEEAARVYDAAARNAFGEFARTNFGDQP